MTEQHKVYFKELGLLIRAKLRAAIEGGLITDEDVISVVGKKLIDADRPYLEKIGLSISSVQGVGKDAAAAVTVWFFLDVFSFPKVLITAPSGNTLKDVIWAELASWRRKSHEVKIGNETKPYLEYVFSVQSDKIFHNFHGEKGKEWFAVARTIAADANPDAQSETLAGRHEKFMLYVVDEATGVAAPVFKPLEGSLTGIVNICLLIFNPTRTNGFAFNSHFGGDMKRWVQIRWNAEESPRVSKEQIAMMAERYGNDSNPYRIRILGLPPRAESNSLISPDYIEDAKVREIIPTDNDPLIMALDCGAGRDKSILGMRKGGKVFPFRRFSTTDSNMLVAWVRGLLLDLEPDVLIGDSRGWGWHIIGELRKDFAYSKTKVRAFDSSESAKSKSSDEKFFNWRADAYWNVKMAFENALISIPNDYNLCDQLSVTRIDDKEIKGRFKIIKKSDIKKLMTDSGTSPDEADALAMLYAFDDRQFRKIPRDSDNKRHQRRRDLFDTWSEHSWMTA